MLNHCCCWENEKKKKHDSSLLISVILAEPLTDGADETQSNIIINFHYSTMVGVDKKAVSMHC